MFNPSQHKQGRIMSLNESSEDEPSFAPKDLDDESMEAQEPSKRSFLLSDADNHTTDRDLDVDKRDTTEFYELYDDREGTKVDDPGQGRENESDDSEIAVTRSLDLADSRSGDEPPTEYPSVLSLLRIQRTILKKKAFQRPARGGLTKRVQLDHPTSDEETSDVLTRKFRWQIYTGSLPQDFFTSDVAKMRITSRIKRGERSYPGLAVTPDNCEDLDYIYRVGGHKYKADMGQQAGTWEQLRLVIGQYCRHAVVHQVVLLENLYKRGAILGAVRDLGAIESFLSYFMIRGMAGTVLGKSTQLIKVADVGKAYFKSLGKEEVIGNLSTVTTYLQGISKTSKYEARRQASENREKMNREQSALLIQPADFKQISQTALGQCDGLLRTFAQYRGAERGKGLFELCQKKTWFIRKWCLNFLCLLIFYGGGQRPQVFTLLQTMTPSQLDSTRAQAKKEDFFEMGVSQEKRARSVDLPNLCLPSRIFRFVDFHVRHMLPLLYLKRQICGDDERRKYLLLHTETGNLLDSASVTATLRVFLKKIDPELGRISTMHVRSSFATLMMQRYRSKKIFKDMTEERFLFYLAKVMNTSPDQLRQTYISCSEMDFRACAASLTAVIDDLGDDEHGRVDSD